MEKLVLSVEDFENKTVSEAANELTNQIFEAFMKKDSNSRSPLDKIFEECVTEASKELQQEYNELKNENTVLKKRLEQLMHSSIFEVGKQLELNKKCQQLSQENKELFDRTMKLERETYTHFEKYSVLEQKYEELKKRHEGLHLGTEIYPKKK